MREVLFRAKRFDTGEWIYGYFVQQKNNLGGIHSCIFQNFEEENRWEMKKVRLETVCQYTGMTDKNVRKIFEGDIINDIDYGVMKCIYLHGSFVWYKEDGFKIKCMRYVPVIEVIGNIFDNPELIGVKP